MLVTAGNCEAAGPSRMATDRLEAALSVLRAASVDTQGSEADISRDLSAAHALGALALERLRRASSPPPAVSCERRPARAAELLTPGERRVATLVAAGLTNRQISRALFVTVGAVQFHLSNTYRKLGLSSREDLMAALTADTSAQMSARPAAA